MSAIRPDLPAVTPPAKPPAARHAQAAFFRAALDGASAVAAGAPRSDRAGAPRPASQTADADRIARPGSLLDIRV